MIKKSVKNILTFFTVMVILVGIFVAAAVAVYLKVLPWAVSNPKVISYVEDISSKALGTDVRIENPILKTSLIPMLYFGVGKVNLSDQNGKVLNLENFGSEFYLAKIFDKNVKLNNANIDYLYADVNKIMALPCVKTSNKKQQKSDWNIDVFNSVLSVKNAVVKYQLDKNTNVKVEAKNVKISDDISKKYINYDLIADISKGKDNLHIVTSDDGKVYIKNKEKIVIENSKINVNKSMINMAGSVDNNSNYDIKLSSKNFEIPAVIDLLNSQIVENNLSEQLAYFKDINGKFDFVINANNKGYGGNVYLKKLSFKLIPFMDLPILLNNGKVSFDDKNITLKDFKGYYNNKTSNTMDFSGTVKDYLKSVDTDLTGNAVVNNDFSQNYLSKMIGYPMLMKGKADTRVVLKSKYNKIDLTWLYMFKKGNGFVVDGEESFMNNAATRVLVAKMHFDNMLLNIKSLDYYAGNPDGPNRAQARIPIVSMNGNIDFSDGKTFIKDFGLELPKPMPSGFINMLIKQKLFKNGTFTGHIKVINTGKYPVIQGNMKAEKVAIPSQRVFIRNGEFKTDKDHMHISSDGRYRRSEYGLTGSILNEIKFPIVVKNITLSLDSVDVEKYLQAFNAQTPTTSAQDVNAAISDSVAKGGDIDDDDDTPTFDLANLIVEECILKVGKGFYKKINFANVVANLTLDKNSLLKITSNRFDIAEGTSSAKINCDLKNHKYSIWLGIKEVNSDIIATSLLNLSKEIDGKASGLIELNTDDSLKLNGKIKFRIYKGTIGKIGLVEYVMKVAALFRNPLTMVSPSVISDLVNVPEGKFDQIDGQLILKNNIVVPMMITSSAPQLSSFIIGTYNLENQDAALRIYTKFSNRRKGLYGLFRNLSLNSLANRIPLSTRNDNEYYAYEISHLPKIDADEKDCQIFLTKVDGDIEHNNFISSLKKIK